MSDIEVLAVSVSDTPSSPRVPDSTEAPPVRKPTAWQAMRASMLRDTKIAAILALLGTNAITGYKYLAATLDDPRDYIAYNGSFGPLAYLPDNKLVSPTYGPAQSVFHAGDRVSFVTNLCVAPGVSITGRAELVRTAQSGLPETVVDRHIAEVPPSMHRCGPRVSSFEFQQDALPGTYEIRRTVAVDGETSPLRQWWPLVLKLEPLDLQIVTTLRTGPTDRSEDGALTHP